MNEKHECENGRAYTYLELVLLAIDNHSGDLLIHEDQYGCQKSRKNGSEPQVRGILCEWIDDPTTAQFGCLELSRYDQFRCVETDEVVDEHVDENGQNDAEIAHLRTDLDETSVQGQSNGRGTYGHR